MAAQTGSRDVDRRRTLVLLWTTYASLYLCRVNVGPAVVSIRQALGLSAVEVGLVLGSIKLGYAVGQLGNGQLTERFGPRRILLVGMGGSALVTLLIGSAPWLVGLPVVGGLAAAVGATVGSLGAWLGVEWRPSPLLGLLVALAIANGWFQSGGWPPTVKIAGHWFPLAERGRTMGRLGTSLSIGSALSIFLVGALLSWVGGWRVAFYAPAVILLASCANTALRLRERPSSGAADAATPAPRLPLRDALAATLGNARIWILAFGLFGLDAVRYGFLDWAPGHLAQVHGTGPLSASLKAAVFPLAGALGALVSGPLTDRYFQSRRGPMCAILLAAVGVLTLVYRQVVTSGVLPTVVCLALVGFCLFGAQILLVGTAAQDFARRGATAAAAGLVDFVGHLGAFSGDVVTGWALRTYGWGGAIVWWASAAFAAALVVATLWRARPAA